MTQYRIRKDLIHNIYYAEVKVWFFWRCLHLEGKVLKRKRMFGDYRLEQAHAKIRDHKEDVKRRKGPRYEIVYREPVEHENPYY